MKFLNKKLLIFDLDGTLIDSVPDLAAAINAMLTELKQETFDENKIRFWVGNGAQTLVKRALLGKREIDDFIEDSHYLKALEIFLEIYKTNLCIETKLYADVKETLQELHNMGYILTIVTNKPSAFIKPILKKLAIEEYFLCTLGADSLDEKKPSPKPLLHLCKELHIKPEQTLMIGDSKNDIIAAKSANIESIALSYGYNYGEDIAYYKPDAIIDEFKTLKIVLGKEDAKQKK